MVLIIIIATAGCSKNKDIVLEEKKENILENSIFLDEKEVNLPENAYIKGWKNDNELLAEMNNGNDQNELCSININTGEKKKIAIEGQRIVGYSSKPVDGKIFVLKNDWIYLDDINENKSEAIMDVSEIKNALVKKRDLLPSLNVGFVEGDRETLYVIFGQRTGENVEYIVRLVDLKTKNIVKSEIYNNLDIRLICCYKEGDKKEYYAVSTFNDIYQIINEGNTLKMNLVEKSFGPFNDRSYNIICEYYLTKDNRIMEVENRNQGDKKVLFYNLQNKKVEAPYIVTEGYKTAITNVVDYNIKNNLVFITKWIDNYGESFYFSEVKNNTVQTKYKLKPIERNSDISKFIWQPYKIFFNESGKKAVFIKGSEKIQDNERIRLKQIATISEFR